MEATPSLEDRPDQTLGQLVDRSAQPCASVDMEGRFRRVNPAFEGLVGYDEAELKDMGGVESITPGRWHEAGRRAHERVLATGQAMRYEKEYLRKDGRIVAVEVALDLETADDGSPRGFFGFVTDISDRKRAEEALRESETRFRALYDEAPFGYHEIDAAGIIVSINGTECAMLGHPREAMLGRPITDFVAPEQREVARVAVAEKLAGTRPLRPLERPYITSDGRRRVMAIEESYRLDGSGRIAGIRSTLQDVTLRKRTETALIASERRNRAFFDGIEDAVFVHDVDGRILDANPAACRRLGYTRDEFLTLTTAEVDAPETASGYQARLAAQFERGRLSFEGAHRTKDGRTIPVDINTSTILFEGRRAVLAVVRDITERKALEDARREIAESHASHARDIELKNVELTRSEARYRQLAEGSLDAIVATDRSGTITLFNPAAEAAFGYPAEEVVGGPIGRLIPDEEASCDVGRTTETRGVRKSGESFPIEVALGAVELGGGEIQWIASIRDQTERQRMRAMLHQSERLASIGLLSAGVAHEINNPLAYVANNLAVLERDLKGMLAILDGYDGLSPGIAASWPDEARRIAAIAEDLDWTYVRGNVERMVGRTRDGVGRIAAIVQNLRGLARTSAPKLEVCLVRDLVGPAIEMVRGRARRQGVDLAAIEPLAIRVSCVSSQIGQVVLNLLVNALHAVEAAGRPGGGRIVVSAAERDDEIEIAIADDGTGIAPEDLPMLFDPFYTTKAVGEGTGLGLSISHGIVTGHGGRIDVETVVGRGTTFRIVLPRGSGQDPHPAAGGAAE